MAAVTEKVEQLVGSLDALRAELDELRRRVAVSDEEIDLLQNEAARNKSKWYREPSVLVAALALAVSVVTFVIGQVNVISDRQIQDRDRLSALIEKLPTILAQARENPESPAGSLLYNDAENAMALIDKLGPEASTAYEKIQVATVLITGYDLSNAMRLATHAEQQSTNVPAKIAAANLIGNLNFVNNNAPGGRDVYRRSINLIQTQQNELDPPLLRNQQVSDVELRWAGDEFYYAKNCPGAMEQLKNAKQALDRLPADRVTALTAKLDNLTKTVTAGCPTAVR